MNSGEFSNESRIPMAKPFAKCGSGKGFQAAFADLVNVRDRDHVVSNFSITRVSAMPALVHSWNAGNAIIASI